MLIALGVIAVAITIVYLVFGSFEDTMFSVLEGFKSNPVQYSIWSLSILASDIVLPVPSSIIMYLNGVVLGVVSGAGISFVSLMITAVIGYMLGAFIPTQLRNLPDERVNQLLARYGAPIIIITRGIPILSESICIVCGYNRLPFKWYLLLNAAGYLPMCIIYAYFGFLGKNQSAFVPGLVGVLFISGLFWIFSRQLTAKFQKT